MARTRRWVRDGRFDVLHVHEPVVPSTSMLACFAASGPLVATFHTSTTRSRALQVFGNALQPVLEKLTGRIAVSPAARRVVVEHLGGDAVLIPNGVDVARFAAAEPLPDRPDAPTVVFLGRIDEPRKGLAVLLEALPELVRLVPDVRLLVAGPGDVDEVRQAVPASLRDRVELLGLVSEQDKPRCTPAATSTARRTRTASPSASCWWRPWPPARRRGERPRGLPPGAGGRRRRRARAGRGPRCAGGRPGRGAG
jgi:phosphatidylinositol alpha-mannosyltransferase